jgi:hypothetical protein
MKNDFSFSVTSLDSSSLPCLIRCSSLLHTCSFVEVGLPVLLHPHLRLRWYSRWVRGKFHLHMCRSDCGHSSYSLPISRFPRAPFQSSRRNEATPEISSEVSEVTRSKELAIVAVLIGRQKSRRISDVKTLPSMCRGSSNRRSTYDLHTGSHRYRAQAPSSATRTPVA